MYLDLKKSGCSLQLCSLRKITETTRNGGLTEHVCTVTHTVGCYVILKIMCQRTFSDIEKALWEAEAGRSQGQEFDTDLANLVKPRLY